MGSSLELEALRKEGHVSDDVTSTACVTMIIIIMIIISFTHIAVFTVKKGFIRLERDKHVRVEANNSRNF